MLSQNERIALYTLMDIPGMYASRLHSMYAHTRCFQDLLFLSERDYLSLGIFKRMAEPGSFDRARKDPAFLSLCEKKYHQMEKEGIRMIDFTEEEMPKRFSSLSDPPLALFVKGELPVVDRPTVSIIGSRQSSEYGNLVARHFGKELSAKGVQIISGMARGIDSSALEGGLCGGSGCFAVLGSGVGVCYPASSRTVYNRMSSGAGGILSEYCPDAPGLGYHFVTRNRLIAALGDVLVVIEAKEKSGTTITVESALAQGKDVFALPGRITDPLGYGCNRLLKEGAMVLTRPEDILEYLKIEPTKKDPPVKADPITPETPETVL